MNGGVVDMDKNIPDNTKSLLYKKPYKITPTEIR